MDNEALKILGPTGSVRQLALFLNNVLVDDAIFFQSGYVFATIVSSHRANVVGDEELTDLVERRICTGIKAINEMLRDFDIDEKMRRAILFRAIFLGQLIDKMRHREKSCQSAQERVCISVDQAFIRAAANVRILTDGEAIFFDSSDLQKRTIEISERDALLASAADAF